MVSLQKIVLKAFLVFSFIGCQSRPTVVVSNGLTENNQFEYADPPLWNSSMQKMKQHLLNLEPYTFDRFEFKKPENRRLITRELHSLAEVSKNVKHDPVMNSKDPTVRFVAEQFSGEMREAEENFSMGMAEFTRWQLMRATKYCLECHTRMNDGVVQRSATTNPPYVKTLPPVDQIELMIAFRQFQPAFDFVLETINKIKTQKDYNFNVDRIARLGFLISVQQMEDRNQALRLVDAINKNPGLPAHLKESNQQWRKSLDQWNPNQRLDTMAAMQKLSKDPISDIESMRLIPALLKYLNQAPNDEEFAQALYLIGENYENLSKISTFSLPENYYELCITKFPKSSWAKKSYERFEDLTILGYSGSSGTRIPKRVQDHLDELKELIQ